MAKDFLEKDFLERDCARRRERLIVDGESIGASKREP